MLALLIGADAYGVERSLSELSAELAAPGGPVDVWRVSGAELDLDLLSERLATQPLFGGGTLVVVEEPEPLVRSAAARERLGAAIDGIAPGNGLAFVAFGEPGAARSGALADLERTIRARGGQVLSFPPPTRERMEAFIAERAREVGARIEPRAARLLAERVGAWVREGDVDRRRQALLAAAEIDKLALFRPETMITADDVRALVSEAIPGSAWGFLDAVGARRTDEAARLLGRLLADGTPQQVLVVQLHRRLRSLLEIRAHLAAGVHHEALPRLLKMKPYRAEKLAAQARAWSLEELELALDGLFELDVQLKGLEGVSASEPERVLALELWLVEQVTRPRTRPAPA